MSALSVTMAADSTQGDDQEAKKRRKHKTHKKNKKLKVGLTTWHKYYFCSSNGLQVTRNREI